MMNAPTQYFYSFLALVVSGQFFKFIRLLMTSYKFMNDNFFSLEGNSRVLAEVLPSSQLPDVDRDVNVGVKYQVTTSGRQVLVTASATSTTNDPSSTETVSSDSADECEPATADVSESVAV